MRQAFETQAEHAEWDLYLDECGQRVEHVRVHDRVAGDVSDLIDTAGKRQRVIARPKVRRRLQILKNFSSADDGSMLVVDRNGADADRNFISGFVMYRNPTASAGCEVLMARATGQSSLQNSHPG